MALTRRHPAALAEHRRRSPPTSSPIWRAKVSPGPLPSPTAGWCMLPAARRRRSLPSRLPARSPICARWRKAALRSTRRGAFIYFRLAADQDQFLTIAKFRALRKLWARIEEACGLEPRPAFVAAETAWRMMTKRDPHGNIVRGTIAALGAAVGGADAVTVLPFSAALGLPDAFARRIARNTQTILIEEANIHRVADPAAGSGAIEALTDALCAAAWTLFQEIERRGRRGRGLRVRHRSRKRSPKSARSAGQCRAPQGHADRHQRLPRSRRGQGRGAGAAAAGGALRRRHEPGAHQARGALRAACATGAMPILPSTARGRRCSSPVSAAPPISTRGRVSPRACSSPAASKRWKANGDNLAKRFTGIGREARLPLLLGQGL